MLLIYLAKENICSHHPSTASYLEAVAGVSSTPVTGEASSEIHSGVLLIVWTLPLVVSLLAQSAMDHCHADIPAVPVVYVLHIALDDFQTEFNSSALARFWKDLLPFSG